jgi:hypothetical protein
MDKRQYIRELFEVVSTTDILIINRDNQLIRLNVPFSVLVVVEGLPGLSIGDLESVSAIRMNLKLIDIYVVNGKPYYYYNFVVCQ